MQNSPTRVGTRHRAHQAKKTPPANKLVYGITFVFDKDILANLHQKEDQAQAEFGAFLGSKGFNKQQPSLFIGDGTEKTNSVSCVLAVQEFARENVWFALSIKDICLLQIFEQSDMKRLL
jgi:virulence-associated protein VapD